MKRMCSVFFAVALVLSCLLVNFPAVSFAAETPSQNENQKENTAETVAAQIEALPSLEEIQAKPMEEQGKDYEQVQAVYAAYCALSAEQQALLPPAEEVFKPYFDYFNSQVSAVWSGSGTSSSPYLIKTEADLRTLATNVKSGKTYSGTYFKLYNDITLTSDWTPIGTASYKFRGTFDGNGKTISGMKATGSYVGLFAYIGSGATIKNVSLTNYEMAGPSYVAGLVAHADAGTGSITISGCSVSGTLRDNEEAYADGYIAGIVAYANAESGAITISRCTTSGSVVCDYHSGGIVGYGKGTDQSLKIQYCTNNAFIDADDDANACGGIAGTISGAELVGCMNYGNVYGNGYSEDYGSSWLGGISGQGSGNTFIGCGNYGNVTTFFAGGITASQGANVAIDCLNVGSLYHSSDGYGCQIIYTSAGGTIQNCYYGTTGMASGGIAYALREYFGQTIGVDNYPVPLTSGNRVYKVTVVGEVSGTYYVNYGGTVALPALSDCAAYFDGDSKFSPSTPITRDYALAALGYHNYVDGTCSDCGKTGVNYVGAGSCGASVVWILTEDGVLTISGSGAMTNYSSANATPWKSYASQITSIRINEGITAIGSYAFMNLTNVTSVTLPSTLVTIGENGFYGLNQLTTITLPDTVTSIGPMAFGYCTVLERVTLGKQLKTIGDYAFYNCQALYSVSVPTGVTTLGLGAFRNCTGLQYIYLYSGLTTVGDYAFAGTALSYVTFPATVTQIGDYVFNNCTALTQVTFNGAAPQIASAAFSGNTLDCYVPNYDSTWASNVQKQFSGTLSWSMGSGTCGDSGDNVKWVLDFTGTLTISGTGDMYEYGTYYGTPTAPWGSMCEKVLKVVIEEGVTSIGDYAFYGCSNLSSISIADSVTAIGKETTYSGYGCCFYDCDSLTEITIPKNVSVIAYNAFAGCNNLTAINVASGNTYFSSADGVLYNRYKTTLRAYPAGKTGAFTVPSGVYTISDSAFKGCQNLTAITLPSSLTTIDRNAFNDCKNLTAITIPSSVTTLGYQAFYYCTGLKTVTFQGSLPASVSTYVFSGVKADAYVPAGDSTWTTTAMKNLGVSMNWHLGSGSCGTNVKWELTYKSGNADLVISGTGAMSDYTVGTTPWASYIADIKTVTVSSGVTYIGAYALCPGTNSTASTSLTTVTLADTVTSIGNSAFTYCSKLSNVTWGNGLQTIGENAFSCTGLTSITFPNSLVTVGKYAFQYCYSLKSLTFGNKLKTIGYTAFGGCSALQTVNLGTSVTTLDQSAFNGCSKLTKMVIPASVTTVGTYAFRNCTSLQYIEFQGNAPTFNTNAFSGTTCNAYYLSSKTGWTSSKLANYGGTLTWGAVSQRGTCSSNTEWILDTAGNMLICGSGSMATYSETNRAPWYDCRDSIKTVTFKGVTSVGNYAFADCAKLQVVIFETSVSSFGTNSFSGTTCEMWYKNTLSTSYQKDYGGTLTWRKVTSLGNCGTTAKWALDSTGALVILGSGAMPYYSSSYQPWYSLKSSIKSVVVGGELTTISDSAFWGFEAIQSITIGSSVKTIEEYAFNGCKALVSVTIPDSVTTIETRAFAYCDALKTVVIGEKVSSIGSMAFASAKALQSVSFLGNAPTIYSNAFSSTTTTAYYPLKNTTWTTSKLTNYGGTLTWEAVCLRHSEVILPAVAATCTQPGKTEGKQCSICNEVLVAQQEITATGHYVLDANGNKVTASSVTAPCLNDISCVVCGNVAVKALGHRVLGTTYIEKDPITITNSSSYRFNLVNGTYYSTNTAASSSSDLKITAKYDCTLTLNYGVSSEEDYDKLYILLNGSTQRTASGEASNVTLTLKLSAGDVVIVRYKKDGSYNEGQDRGWATLVYDWVQVEGTGDVPADTAEPDCTNAVVCKYCQTVVKEALGHRVIVEQPEPENPYEVENNTSYPFELTDGTYYSTNKEHSSSAELVFKANGNGTFTLNYGVSSEQNADKLTILFNGTVMATISGITTDQVMPLAVVPGDVITVRYSKDSSINKNEDRGWVSVQYVSEPKVEILPADDVAADCDGVTCSYCQTLVKEALGHDMGQWVTTLEATCIEAGENRSDCSRCDHFETAVIEAKGHSYTAEITKEPTCNETGIMTHTCSACNETKTEEIAKIAEHKYENGVCIYCQDYLDFIVSFVDWDGTVLSTNTYHWGDEVAAPEAPTREADDTYAYNFAGWDKEIVSCAGDATYTATYTKQYRYAAGDINCNDAVDHNDAIYLLLHTMFGGDHYPLNGVNADVDGSGTVDQEDAIYLLLHTLFGEAFYPLSTPALPGSKEETIG